MKVLVEIADNEASFAMKVLNSLSFVKIATPLSTDAIALWHDLNEVDEQVQLNKQGKLN